MSTSIINSPPSKVSTASEKVTTQNLSHFSNCSSSSTTAAPHEKVPSSTSTDQSNVKQIQTNEQTSHDIQSNHDNNTHTMGNFNMNPMMGLGGYSSYGMGGFGYSPYMGGMGMGGMGGMPIMGGALSSINQLLFSFQSVIFSLGQAVQILGMNTQALHQLYDQAISMMDQILSVVNELKTLERKDETILTQEEQKRRRRLKALRWGIVLSISYAGYSMVYKWLKRRRDFKKRRLMGMTGTTAGGIDRGSMFTPQPYQSYFSSPSSSYVGQMQQQQYGGYGSAYASGYGSGYQPPMYNSNYPNGLYY